MALIFGNRLFHKSYFTVIHSKLQRGRLIRRALRTKFRIKLFYNFSETYRSHSEHYNIENSYGSNIK